MTLRLLIVLASFYCLFAPRISYGAVIALFPLDDLSLGRNSVNEEFDRLIGNRLEDAGYEVISGSRIYAFLSDNRIRRISYLQSAEIRLAGVALDADYILLGTICQKHDTPPAVGLTVRLIRTSDSRSVWGQTEGLSVDDVRSVLGIHDRDSIEGLYKPLVAQLFQDFPTAEGPGSGLTLARAESVASAIEVDSVLFTPQYVQPGHKVQCVITFKTLGKSEVTPRVYVKVGSRLYSARTEDGRSYQTSWIGSPQHLWPDSVALAALRQQSLRGVFSGYREDARYPVSLVIEREDGRFEKEFVGSYVVDSVPPLFEITPFGNEIDGQVCFTGQLPIAIRWLKKEILSSWELRVLDGDKREVFREYGRGMVPDRLFWNGRNLKNSRVAGGRYTVVLELKDRAGNIGSASTDVVCFESRPEVAISLLPKNDTYSVAIDYQDEIPVRDWRLEIWSATNTLLQRAEGTDLPVQFPLTFKDEGRTPGIGALFSFHDTLGRRVTKKIENLWALLKEDEKAEHPQGGYDEGWQVDF